MEAGKERFARVRVWFDALVGAEAPLRNRVRATTAVLSAGATCMFSAAGGRPGQAAGYRAGDGHRPDQLSPRSGVSGTASEIGRRSRHFYRK
jgi:hypothetical protein